MYFVDMKWFAKDYAPENLDSVTIQTIMEDVVTEDTKVNIPGKVCRVSQLKNTCLHNKHFASGTGHISELHIKACQIIFEEAKIDNTFARLF